MVGIYKGKELVNTNFRWHKNSSKAVCLSLPTSPWEKKKSVTQKHFLKGSSFC
jgi:hypothetical protein